MRHSKMTAFKHFFAPRSLRYQLLNRSLIILAALFLLIGVLQYVLMKDFIYKNKAEALKAQVMSMPTDWFTDPNQENDDMDSREPKGRPEPNNESVDPNAEASVEPGTGTDTNTDTDTTIRPEPNDRPDGRGPDSSILYQPDLSIAFIDLNGKVTDLSMAADASPPHLTAEQYLQIKNDLLNHKTVDYQIAKNSLGEEQLVIYCLAGPPDKAEGVIQVSAETSSLRQLLMTQLAIFTGLAILALAAGLALYLPLLRRTLTPLSRVVTAAQQTDAGNLTERLPIDQGQQEIDRLSDAFNGMLQRLDTSFEAERKTTEKMRRFVADASHELRTPLTSIHGFLEVLLRGAAANSAQLYRALNSMQLESRRINRLVEDLLLLAKLDQAPQLQLAETRLDALIQEMEPQLHMLAGNRTVKLEFKRSASGSFHADKLKQVLLNLFLNAVQHTDSETGIITISLDVKDNQAELLVADNGAGIAEEHVPYLFERFYRSESSRTRKNGGAGLGLAITKSIIDAHMGTIEVHSKPGGGTTFQILLPLNRS